MMIARIGRVMLRKTLLLPLGLWLVLLGSLMFTGGADRGELPSQYLPPLTSSCYSVALPVQSEHPVAAEAVHHAISFAVLRAGFRDNPDALPLLKIFAASLALLLVLLGFDSHVVFRPLRRKTSWLMLLLRQVLPVRAGPVAVG